MRVELLAPERLATAERHIVAQSLELDLAEPAPLQGHAKVADTGEAVDSRPKLVPPFRQRRNRRNGAAAAARAIEARAFERR
jgi:hypothetical protein